MVQTGAIPRSDIKRMDEHAERYYDEIRARTSDVAAISANTGFTLEAIAEIKEHIFIREHDLGKKKRERFVPDYDMAVSWQRLIEGKDIREPDVILLNHELEELKLMKSGLDFEHAHKAAEEKYNYTKYVRELDISEGMR